MYNQFFSDISCKDICGLTATPYRLVMKYYKEGTELYYVSHLAMINRIYPFFFKKFAYKISNRELTDQGYLCELDYLTYDDFNTDGIKINSTGADYDKTALEKFWTDSRLKKLSDIIMEIDKKVSHNLIFCSSIRQATRGKEMLNEMGFNSTDIVTSKHKKKEREQVIADFRSGRIKHLFNVGVLSHGFDFPELDCITLARPTISLGLYYQQIGRGIRILPNGKEKRCLVVDITNNMKRMGKIETIKIEKEEDGFRDKVVTEKGDMTNKPLFKFKIKDIAKKEKITAGWK
jgi:DNA repair protein RadD